MTHKFPAQDAILDLAKEVAEWTDHIQARTSNLLAAAPAPPADADKTPNESPMVFRRQKAARRISRQLSGGADNSLVKSIYKPAKGAGPLNRRRRSSRCGN